MEKNMNVNNESNLPILSQNVDKSQVPSIDQKRMLAFINHFIVNTVTFLNKFIANCETKFIEFESKLQKIESSLIIVEAKLASMPDNNEQKLPSEPPNSNDQPSVLTTDNPNNVSIDTVSSVKTELTDIEKLNDGQIDSGNGIDEIDKKIGVKACEDIRYRKYFKMMQFGVPAAAVKLKMAAEGFIPNILDEPNRILEDGIARNESEDA